MTAKPTFAELLAAKKASLAKTINEPLPEIEELPVVEKPLSFKERMEQQAIPHDTVEDVPDAPASKPMTFAERMAAAKQAASTEPTEPTPTPAQLAEAKSNAEEAASLVALPKVVISSDVIKLSNQVALADKASEAIEEGSSTEEIKSRIDRLASLSGLDLKLAMDGLKSLILANPSACTQLLPEDVGDMVAALRKMTSNEKAAVMAAPKRASSKKEAPSILAPDDLDALLGDLLA